MKDIKMQNHPSLLNTQYADQISAEALALVKKSDKFVKSKLSHKPRADGTNAYIHSVRVANYISSELRYSDPAIIVTALLHDTVEDSECSTYSLANQFGYKIAEYVDSLTRAEIYTPTTDAITKLHIKTVQNLSFYKKPYKVQIVKCVDRIDNLRSIQAIPESHDKYRRIPYWIVETESSLLQIAKSLDPQIHIDLLKEIIKVEDRFGSEVDAIRSDYKEYLSQF